MEIKLANTGDLLPGKMIDVSYLGQSILLANLKGKYYAIGNRCTHLGCLLSKGILKGAKVHCPCYGSIFDIRTGEVLTGPAKDPEPIFKLKIDGDKIMLVTQ